MASKEKLENGAPEPAFEQDRFQRQLPDNCVEYLLFVPDSQVDTRKQLAQIESIRKSAIQLASSLTKDYIWQKDEFNLELKNERGLVYLHGITDYSDAVEDEWLIVYILRELTKLHPNLWVRAHDTDGEFLLIEAANVLPKWLNPEIDHNRAWIKDGKLFIIPLKEEVGLKSQSLSLPDAVEALRSKPKALVHSTFIEAEAFYRLEKYPVQITDSIHYSLVTVPRKIAFVLHSLQKSIAPAVEAFYLRDALALKCVVNPPGPLTFPPADLVTVSAKFSRVLFAQLRSQRFETPPTWQAVFQRAQKEASSTDAGKTLARLDFGMKLTCGFEMLAANAEKSKSRVVREFAITLEDLKEDGDDALPSDEEIKSWKDIDRDDSEAWMDINFEEFERELEGKRGKQFDGAASGFGDVKTQSDLRKIVSRFEAFLNDDDAGMDGAEHDDMDDDDDEDSEEDSEFEDKDVSFDEDEFSRMMSEMMGMPPADKKTPVTAKGKQPAQLQGVEPASTNEEDEKIKQLASEFEAELNQHGALKLDPKPDKKPRVKDSSASAVPAGKPGQDAAQLEAVEEEDSDEEVDIDYNLAKNLLESFKSQAGMAGPTGNLLGMMGFQLPRDEDDGEEEEDDETGGPSQKGNSSR
ncbi:SGT1 protein-domain-containing protein [Dactylonectria estremocensis]|uniref:SGT1 protein-domain-containing protein n=1 Tax=Dactylonectria estremocensis TaxID=1079267 RepID=A0A9P9J8R4_9HYPO|nr:SGT1 protein-domain-containing protein [Dactylonectria estremocensis]